MRAKPDWQFYVSVAVLVGIVATGVIAMVASGDESTRDVPNHYFRVEIVEERLDPPVPERTKTLIEAWHLDDKWRWQLWEMEGRELVELSELVVDGGTYYSHDLRRNTYFSERVLDAQPFLLLLGVGFILAASSCRLIPTATRDGNRRGLPHFLAAMCS